MKEAKNMKRNLLIVALAAAHLESKGQFTQDPIPRTLTEIAEYKFQRHGCQ